ncbi:MAG: FAD-dependent oxidoreductase [Deltaproteobacteria bacterium]|nr:FAD-dependent oxidoreductase [Deltaproteobacteria bacterium]
MDKVTCIVVGAGPAGSACALALARKGVETVLFERGRVPGEKNVSSFVLYAAELKRLIPDFRKDLPFERMVVRTDQVYLGPNDSKALTSHNYRWVDDPIAFTAFRRKFDAWFAKKAVDAGVQLMSGMKVGDLIKDGDQVVGVKVGEEELYADVVVGADGYHTVVGEKSGLVTTWKPERCYLAVKEVLDLPAAVINERFQLTDGIACEQGIYCYRLNELDIFSATMYTNRDSISLAVFARLDELQQKHIRLHEQLDKLKEHPYVNNLIKGAVLREYQAHILSDGGRIPPENLYGDGVILCGEAGGITATTTGMGVPTCILSGMMAAETIGDAVKKQDFSKRSLKHYVRYLDTTALLGMIHRSRRESDYYAGPNRSASTCEMETAADLYNRWWLTDVQYLSEPFFSLPIELYLGIGQFRLPVWLRWPVTFFIKLCLFPARFAEAIKRKTRSRYYEWKK